MFTTKTAQAVGMAADLLNTAQGMRSAQPSSEELGTVDSLAAFISDHQQLLRGGSATATAASRASKDKSVRKPSARDVTEAQELRERTERFWSVVGEDDAEALSILNALLEGISTVVVPDETPAGDDDAPHHHREPVPPSNAPADVLRAHIAQGLQEIVVLGETERLRHCHDDQCDMAIVDLSRNRSKLFCDFGNCANRSHVRAYRARKAEERRAARAAASSTGVSAGESDDPQTAPRTRPSAAEKAAQLAEPTSESAVAAKVYRSQMRDELMEQRKKKDKKKKKKKKKGKSSDSGEG